MGKGKIGGKYSSTRRFPSPADAGNRTEGLGGRGSQKLEFKGPGLKQYTYTREIGGYPVTITVTAHSAAEADRQVETRGYSSYDRDKKRRKRRK